jgi:peptide/nickel transport system ATP-binding protein
MEQDNILVVKDLKKYYPITDSIFGKAKAFVKAVDGLSYEFERGSTMGLVGESGCGKTTVGRTILRLHDVTDERFSSTAKTSQRYRKSTCGGCAPRCR